MYNKTILATTQQSQNLYGGNYGGIENYFAYIRNYFGQSIYDQVTAGFMQQSSVYTDSLRLDEWHLYGSSRIGIYQTNKAMAQRTVRIENGVTTQLSSTHIEQLSLSRFTVERGAKRYELTNHLGNVLTVVTDKKLPVCSGTSISYFIADVVSATDYSPFGAPLAGRTWQGGEYRYGFNGKEKDDEVKGEGNFQDYGFRVYDNRLGKFLSEDPLRNEYPMLTPYQFAANMPIWAIDLDGLEGAKATVKYVVRIFNVNQDGHVPLKQGETWTDKNSGRKWVAGETIIQEGDPEGPTEIRYTDVNGGDVTTYWVTEPPKPKTTKMSDKDIVEGRKPPEEPKIAPMPTTEKVKNKIPDENINPKPVPRFSGKRIVPGVQFRQFTSNWVASSGVLGSELREFARNLSVQIANSKNINSINISMRQLVGSTVKGSQLNNIQNATRQAQENLASLIRVLVSPQINVTTDPNINNRTTTSSQNQGTTITLR